MIYLKVVMLIIIIVLAVYDIRYLEIPAILVYIGIFIGIIVCVQSMIYIQSFDFLSIIPSLCFICAYFINPKTIGIGDGLVLLMSELTMSYAVSLQSFFIIACSAFIYSIILIANKMSDRKIPFVVFIALGHIVMFLKEELWVNI